MDQKLQRISLSLMKASRRSQIPADQDSFTTMSPGARIVSPGQRPRRPSMEDLFELNNENGIHQRRIMTPTLTKSPSSPGFKGDSLRRPVSREVSRDFSSRSNSSIDAGGEATEALTFVQDDASLRERMLDFLHISGIDRVLDFLQAVFSLIACTLYVIESYDRDLEMNLYVLAVELFIGCFFLFDYCLALFLSENKRKFVFSYISMIDIASIVPVFLDLLLFLRIQESYGDLSDTNTSPNSTRNSTVAGQVNIDSSVEYRYNLNILRIVRVFRIFRILRGWKYLDRNLVHFSYKYIRVVFLMCCILFCSAGLFQQIENAQNLDLLDCMYFTVVTLTTLGYGDIKPVTNGGKIFVLALMISIGVLLPNQIAKLNELRKKEYANKKFKTITNNGHILLCGSLSPRSLLSFLHEIYGMSHGKQDLPLCILANKKPSPVIKSIIKGHWLRDRVTILVGSPLIENDLLRCMVQETVACFVIADTNARMPEREDTKVILGATNIRKLNNLVPIFASVLGGKENTQRLYCAIDGHSTGSQVFSYGIVRQMLIGTNIKCPGAGPLISNLLRSYSLPLLREEDVAKCQPLEYQWGVGFEIYPMSLGIKFRGRNFKDVAKIVYSHFGAIFIGLGRSGKSDKVNLYNGVNASASQSDTIKVLLNPHMQEIQQGDIGFFIARSPLHITQIFNHFSKAALLYGQSGPHNHEFMLNQRVFTGSFSIGKTRLRAKVTDKTFTPSRPRTGIKRGGDTKRASSPDMTTKNETASGILKTNIEHDSSPSPKVNGKRQSFDLGDERLNLLTKHVHQDRENPMFDAKRKIIEKYENEYSKTVAVLRHSNNSSPVASQDLSLTNHVDVRAIFGDLSPSNSEKRKTRNSINFVDNIDIVRETRSVINIYDERNKVDNTATTTNVGNTFVHASLLSLKASLMYNLCDLEIVEKPRDWDAAFVKCVHFKNHIVISCQCRVAGMFHIISRLRLKKQAGTTKRVPEVEGKTLDEIKGISSEGSEGAALHEDNGSSVKKILIMSRFLPTEEEWELLCHFPEIYWFSGDANRYADRLKTSCHLASNIIILHSPFSQETESKCKVQDQFKVDDTSNGSKSEVILNFAQMDFDQISTLNNFYALRRTWNLTIELKHTANHKFLKPQRKWSRNASMPSSLEKLFYFYFKESMHFMSPLYASGKVVSSNLTARVVAQSWYNPQVIGVFHALLGLDNDNLFQHRLNNKVSKQYANDKKRKSISKTLLGNKDDVGSLGQEHKCVCRMLQMPIPKGFVGRPFSDLYTHLVENESLIPLGLFRNGEMNKVPMELNDRKYAKRFPYIYTCPVRDSIVKRRDRVIVLK